VVRTLIDLICRSFTYAYTAGHSGVSCAQLSSLVPLIRLPSFVLHWLCSPAKYISLNQICKAYYRSKLTPILLRDSVVLRPPLPDKLAMSDFVTLPTVFWCSMCFVSCIVH
jgi:hypothetical protein